MSRHERNGGNIAKWTWAHRKGLGITAAGVLVAGGIFARDRLYRGADGLTSFERRGLRATGMELSGEFPDGSGAKPKTVGLVEFVGPIPLEGSTVVVAAGKDSLEDHVSRSGGQRAIAYREGADDWQVAVEDPEAPFADLGRNVLGFHEIVAAIHVGSLVTEVAIGSRILDEQVEFLPVGCSYYKDDGRAWDMAEKYPTVPVLRVVTPPGSAA